MSQVKSENLRAVIFPERKLIGCVLIQATVGGDRELCHLFDVCAWETGDLSGMKKVSGTREQWGKLAEKWNKHHTKEK